MPAIPALGCIIMTAADEQKFCKLKLRHGLITDGMFTWIRRPDYLGEMLICGAFALLAWHWLPALVFACFWDTVFSTNMVMKEVSLARHPEWAAYWQRTWWLLPGVVWPRCNQRRPQRVSVSMPRCRTSRDHRR